MRNKQHLNGCDYLMLGFDHELRRHGFAGNSCQIVLDLGSAISADAVRARLAEMPGDLSDYRRPLRPGLFLPRWQWQPPTLAAPLRARPSTTSPGCAGKLQMSRSPPIGAN